MGETAPEPQLVAKAGVSRAGEAQAPSDAAVDRSRSSPCWMRGSRRPVGPSTRVRAPRAPWPLRWALHPSRRVLPLTKTSVTPVAYCIGFA